MGLALGVTLATLLGLCGFTAAQSNGWRARDIVPVLAWRYVAPVQVVAGLGVAAYVEPVWGLGAAVSAAAFTWLAVLAVATDVRSYKVPWDAPHVVAGIGVVCAAANYSTEAALSFAAAFVGCVAIPFLARAMTRQGLGMSDVRILWAATASLSWWAGQTWLLYALIGACLVQGVVRVGARMFGWGRLVTPGTPVDHDATNPAPAADPTADPAIDPAIDPATPPGTDRLAARAPVTGQVTGHGAQVDLVEPDAHPDSPQRESVGERPVKQRRELPFAPALVISLLTGALWATHVGIGACQFWSVTGAC